MNINKKLNAQAIRELASSIEVFKISIFLILTDNDLLKSNFGVYVVNKIKSTNNPKKDFVIC